MHAFADEPTHRVTWEIIDQDTVRVCFTAEDSSDGIPTPVEPETSRTTAVTIPDLESAMETIVDLAAQAGVRICVFGVRVDERTPTGQARSLRLCVNDWWSFHRWFPQGLKEAEALWLRTLENRKAAAMVYRMRLFAAVVASEQPPRNYTVLVLE